MHDYPCYPVGLAVFGEYMQACTAKSLKKELTDIQQWALDYFQLPSWLWAIFQSFNVDATALAENRRFWQVARYPKYDDDVRVWAAFIQKGGCPPDGIEFIDEFGTLDSQLIRGLKLWNGITFPKLGKGYSSTHQKDADGWWAVTRALLYVVLYPDTYAAAVQQEKLIVATEVNVEPWIIHETVSEEQVTHRLARMGVTVPMVEDMYRYVLKFAENLLDSPKKLGDKNELRDIIVGSKAVIEKAGSTPPGLSALYDAFIPRPPGLPWPDSHMNKVQERGAFLLDIPLRVGGGDVKKVTLRPLPAQLTGPRGSKSSVDQSLKSTSATGGKEKPAVPPVVNNNKNEKIEEKKSGPFAVARYAHRGASRGRGGYGSSHQSHASSHRNAVASSSRRSPPRMDERPYTNPHSSTSIYTSRHAPSRIHPNSMQVSMHALPLAHDRSYTSHYAAPHHPASAFPSQPTFNGPTYPSPVPVHNGDPSPGSWSNTGHYPPHSSSGHYVFPQQVQQQIQFGSASMYSQGGAPANGAHSGGPYDDASSSTINSYDSASDIACYELTITRLRVVSILGYISPREYFWNASAALAMGENGTELSIDLLSAMIASRWWTDDEAASHLAPPAVARWEQLKFQISGMDHNLQFTNLMRDLKRSGVVD
ncbi:hypothetical protein DFH06DRAFT_1302499 [Mycena polygramma]|nr:hypothetical protein DFH06DRAFT_1302499 [Mycena polygramma]